MVRGDGVEAVAQEKKNGFPKPFFSALASSNRVEWRGTERTITEEQRKRYKHLWGARASICKGGSKLINECYPPPPADQTATASDSAMESAPAPMESDEEQDDESVPEVPGTTI